MVFYTYERKTWHVKHAKALTLYRFMMALYRLKKSKSLSFTTVVKVRAFSPVQTV